MSSIQSSRRSDETYGDRFHIRRVEIHFRDKDTGVATGQVIGVGGAAGGAGSGNSTTAPVSSDSATAPARSLGDHDDKIIKFVAPAGEEIFNYEKVMLISIG